jgi:hypothetical protein
MFLNVGSVVGIAETLTYVAVRVPLLGLIKGLWLRLLKPLPNGVKKKAALLNPLRSRSQKYSLKPFCQIFFTKYFGSTCYSTRGAKSEAIIGGPGALPNWPLVFLASICLVTAEHSLEFSHATCQIYCMKKKTCQV